MFILNDNQQLPKLMVVRCGQCSASATTLASDRDSNPFTSSPTTCIIRWMISQSILVPTSSPACTRTAPRRGTKVHVLHEVNVFCRLAVSLHTACNRISRTAWLGHDALVDSLILIFCFLNNKPCRTAWTLRLRCCRTNCSN